MAAINAKGKDVSRVGSMLTDIEGINSCLNAAYDEENVTRIDRVTTLSEPFVDGTK